MLHTFNHNLKDQDFRKGDIVVQSDKDNEPLFLTLDATFPLWKFFTEIIHWTEFYDGYSIFMAGYLDENKKLIPYCNSVYGAPGKYMCGRRIAYGRDKVAYTVWIEIDDNRLMRSKSEIEDELAKLDSELIKVHTAYCNDGVTWIERTPEGIPLLFPAEDIKKSIIFTGLQEPLKCEYVFLYRPPEIIDTDTNINCIPDQSVDTTGYFFIYYIDQNTKKLMVTKSSDLKIWSDSIEVQIKKYNDPNFDDYEYSNPCTINGFNQEFYKNSKRTSTSVNDWYTDGNFSGSLLNIFITDENNKKRMLVLKQAEINGKLTEEKLVIVSNKLYDDYIEKKLLKFSDAPNILPEIPQGIEKNYPWKSIIDVNLVLVMDNTASTFEELQSYKDKLISILDKHYSTATYLNISVVSFEDDDPSYAYNPSLITDPTNGWVKIHVQNVGYAAAKTAIQNIGFSSGGDLPEPTWDALYIITNQLLSQTSFTGHQNVIYFATDQCGKIGAYSKNDFIIEKNSKELAGYETHYLLYASDKSIYNCFDYQEFIENLAPDLLQGHFPDLSIIPTPGNIFISTTNDAGSENIFISDLNKLSTSLMYYSVSSEHFFIRERKLDHIYNPKGLVINDSKFVYCINSRKDRGNIGLSTYRLKIDSVNPYPEDENYFELIETQYLQEQNIYSFKPTIDAIHGNQYVISISSSIHGDSYKTASLYGLSGLNADGTLILINMQFIANPDFKNGEIALISPVVYWDITNNRWVIVCIGIIKDTINFSGRISSFYYDGIKWIRQSISPSSPTIFQNESWENAIKYPLDIEYVGTEVFLIYGGKMLTEWEYDSTDIITKIHKMLNEDIASPDKLNNQTSREKLYKMRIREGRFLDSEPKQHEILSFPLLSPTGYDHTLSYTSLEQKKTGYNRFTFNDKQNVSRTFFFISIQRQFHSALIAYSDSILFTDSSGATQFLSDQIIHFESPFKLLRLLPDIGISHAGLYDYSLFGNKSYTTAYDGFYGTKFLSGNVPLFDIGISVTDLQPPMQSQIKDNSRNFKQDKILRQPIKFTYAINDGTMTLPSQIIGYTHLCFYTRQIDFVWKLFYSRSTGFYDQYVEFGEVSILEIAELGIGASKPIKTFVINPFDDFREGYSKNIFYLIISFDGITKLIKTEDFGITWKVLGDMNLPEFEEINVQIVKGFNPEDKDIDGNFYRYDYLIITKRDNEHSYLVSYKKSDHTTNLESTWLEWEKIREVYISNHEHYDIIDFPKIVLSKVISGTEVTYQGYAIGQMRTAVPSFKMFKIISDVGDIDKNDCNHHYLKIIAELYDLGSIDNLPKFTVLDETLENPDRLITDSNILNSLRLIRNSDLSIDLMLLCSDYSRHEEINRFRTVINVSNPLVSVQTIHIYSKESVVIRYAAQLSNFNNTRSLHTLAILNNGNYIVEYYKWKNEPEEYESTPYQLFETKNQIAHYFVDRSYGEHFKLYIENKDETINIEYTKANLYLQQENIGIKSYIATANEKYCFCNGIAGFTISDRLLKNDLIIMDDVQRVKFQTSKILSEFKTLFYFQFNSYTTGIKPYYIYNQYPYVVYCSSDGNIRKIEFEIDNNDEVQSKIWYGQPSVILSNKFSDADNVLIKDIFGHKLVNHSWQQFNAVYNFVWIRSRAYIVGNELFDINLNFTNMIESDTYTVSFIDPETRDWSPEIDVVQFLENKIILQRSQIPRVDQYDNIVPGSLLTDYRIKKTNHDDKIFYDKKPLFRSIRTYIYDNKFFTASAVLPYVIVGNYYTLSNKDESHFIQLTNIKKSKEIRNLEYEFGEGKFYNWNEYNDSPIRSTVREEELDRFIHKKYKWLSSNTIFEKPLPNLHKRLYLSPELYEIKNYEELDRAKYIHGYSSSYGSDGTKIPDTSVIFTPRNITELPNEPDLFFNLKMKEYMGNALSVPQFVYNTNNKRSILLYFKDLDKLSENANITYGLYLKFYPRTDYQQFSTSYTEYTLGTTNLHEFYFYMPSPKLGRYEFELRYHNRWNCPDTLKITVSRDDKPHLIGLPEEIIWEDSYYDTKIDRISQAMMRKWSARPDIMWDPSDNWFTLFNEFYDEKSKANKVFEISQDSIFRQKYIIWKNANGEENALKALYQQGFNLSFDDYFKIINRNLSNYDNEISNIRYSNAIIYGEFLTLTPLMKTSIKSFKYVKEV
jgi:hypothetical protein